MARRRVTASVGAIILAAGQSRRMGCNKLLMEWNGKPIIAHVADTVASAGLGPPLVVVGNEAEAVERALARRDVRIVPAKDFAEGMAHSLVAGIRAAPETWAAAIICLGDMPLVSPALLMRMRHSAAPAAIVTPVFNGHRGNPILWGRDYFAELTQLTGDSGAKALLDRHHDKAFRLDWSDDGILRDIDDQAALEALRSR